ncbi:bifunctional phosphopantothenoylcysteine decarboxylase/phosphopantothenate--cysteine ligase CoaBC [Leptolyngbya sp. 7M]|uniref:bifunctional phosphopantothenoylcysteine decarboxylase/phosphopantothenate--cysteine ligase CoaBC n=1 Tax=Leptolyngbya sp. 7M TaxID=2812896 RepID=UPI001B8AB630|nr:bifunctional phosphopantothenoylcysteine decarboxylase/phosphopantothenate--cysteine ligase CoaBC [Leptolyngbya sp. 7M]QYO66656.1 bifunctional phosphopantothenoylcysteine decarboxylase/phosphopantothenate--cysteine ligase CoaBC [Leptolyngbya sp. 7M]
MSQLLVRRSHRVQPHRPYQVFSLPDDQEYDYDPANPDPIAHINFSQDIDLLLIVPATANIIAKFANGVADDFLSSTYLASTAPVMIAPAMNTTMWEQPATQRNIQRLKADGVHFVEPVAGELACKTVGTGKLEDVENIVSQALKVLSEKTKKVIKENIEAGRNGDFALKNDLSGERLLITVGGTREAIDPVRFISNHSSGKMGFAVAEAARDRGAEVTVVCGVTAVEPPNGVAVINAVSAREMFDAVMKELANATVFVGAAAVADYAPTNAADAKIKKENQDKLILELKKTPDILSEVSKRRKKGQLVIGFAAETNEVVTYAKIKMGKKDLDMVIANDITKEGAGFNTDTNIATILTRVGSEIELPLMSKRALADRILDEILKIRAA